MNSQTFASPSIGSVAGRGVAGVLALIAGIARSVWDTLGALGQRRARSELLRLADSHARSQPALAAQLRAAANRNWYGEA